MAEYNVKINVKTDTGYDQLYPKSKADIIDFDKSNSNLSSNNVEAAIKEVNTKANTNKTNIGTLASLKTDSKTNLVGAINEVDSHANTATTTANTNKTNIGTLSNLKTTIKNSIVNAINWLYDNVVHKTSIIDNLDDIVANQADGMIAGALAVSQLIDNMKTAQSFSDSGEIETNETWVDGKKIYRRTFITTETVSSDTTVTIPMSLVGIADTLWIDTQNSYVRSVDGGQSYPLPLPRYGGTENYVGVWCNGAGIRIFSDSGWNQQWEKCVTVRYTKV